MDESFFECFMREEREMKIQKTSINVATYFFYVVTHLN